MNELTHPNVVKGGTKIGNIEKIGQEFNWNIFSTQPTVFADYRVHFLEKKKPNKRKPDAAVM